MLYFHGLSFMALFLSDFILKFYGLITPDHPCPLVKGKEHSQRNWGNREVQLGADGVSFPDLTPESLKFGKKQYLYLEGPEWVVDRA